MQENNTEFLLRDGTSVSSSQSDSSSSHKSNKSHHKSSSPMVSLDTIMEQADKYYSDSQKSSSRHSKSRSRHSSSSYTYNPMMDMDSFGMESFSSYSSQSSSRSSSASSQSERAYFTVDDMQDSVNEAEPRSKRESIFFKHKSQHTKAVTIDFDETGKSMITVTDDKTKMSKKIVTDLRSVYRPGVRYGASSTNTDSSQTVSESGKSGEKRKNKYEKEIFIDKYDLSQKDSDIVALRNDGNVINLSKQQKSDMRELKIAFYKLYYQISGLIKDIFNSDFFIATRDFFIKTAEILSIVIVCTVIMFFGKRVSDGALKYITGIYDFNKMLLTVRYFIVWILIVLIAYRPVYHVGFVGAKGREKLDVVRSIAVFFCAEVLYISVSVLFMNYLMPAPILGVLAVIGSYVSSYATAATNLADIADPSLWKLNTFSIVSTLQFVMIPLFAVYLRGAKDRIEGKYEKSESSHEQSSGRFVIVDDLFSEENK